MVRVVRKRIGIVSKETVLLHWCKTDEQELSLSTEVLII